MRIILWLLKKKIYIALKGYGHFNNQRTIEKGQNPIWRRGVLRILSEKPPCSEKTLNVPSKEPTLRKHHEVWYKTVPDPTDQSPCSIPPPPALPPQKTPNTSPFLQLQPVRFWLSSKPASPFPPILHTGPSRCLTGFHVLPPQSPVLTPPTPGPACKQHDLRKSYTWREGCFLLGPGS